MLLSVFRWIERWLHQHLFKVGWLLTNNFQTTTILYYIIFLPGILLHEISLWLAAGVLNVRAERAIQFPEAQEIGELRLNFIQIAAGTGAFKRLIIAAAPLAVGAAALWAIAAHIFDWQATLGITAPGNVDDLARALTALTRKTDFWLWFYLAFTIANTMFPSLPMRLTPRAKLGLAAALPALAFVCWRIVGAANPAFAGGIETLLSNLGLVTLQITGVNIAVVIALGSLESIIERLSGKSATFREGKMITSTVQEAQGAKARAWRERKSGRAAESMKRVAQLESIYELKLPIPGPPGREPISRSVAAVVNLQSQVGDVAGSRPTTPERAPGKASDSRLPQDFTVSPAVKPANAKTLPRAAVTPPPSLPTDDANHAQVFPQNERTKARGVDSEYAPFSRPFAKGDIPADPDEAKDGEGDAADDEPFARPFAMATRTENERDQQPAARARRTEPAPTPSQRETGTNKAAGDIYEEAEDSADDAP